MIIRCKIYFVCFIFVVSANHENIFTTKISRSTVYRFQYNARKTESDPRWGWFWVWDRDHDKIADMVIED